MRPGGCRAGRLSCRGVLAVEIVETQGLTGRSLPDILPVLSQLFLGFGPSSVRPPP